MKILMIGNTCSIGANLTLGLERKGFDVYHVVSEYEVNPAFTGHPDFIFKHVKINADKNIFNIAHVHYPTVKKLKIANKYVKDSGKIIIHFHGTDIRRLKKNSYRYFLIKKLGDMFLYSTWDLRWHIQDLASQDKIFHFRNPVDLEMFYPIYSLFPDRKGKTIFSGGSNATNRKQPILHNVLNDYLNKFEEIEINPYDNIDKNIISVLTLEAGACNLKNKTHSFINRDWVRNNASIESQTKKLIKIYEDVLSYEK